MRGYFCQAHANFIVHVAGAFAAEIFPWLVAVHAPDVAIAVTKPGAIVFPGHIGPIISRFHLISVLGHRVIDPVIDLVRSVNVKTAALADLVGARAGNSRLAANDQQAAAPVIVWRESVVRVCGRGAMEHQGDRNQG